MLKESLVVIVFAKVTPVCPGGSSVKTGAAVSPPQLATASSSSIPIEHIARRNMGRETNAPLPGRISMCSIGMLLLDRKSTRLNSSHSQISYAVFCLKKKKKQRN